MLSDQILETILTNNDIKYPCSKLTDSFVERFSDKPLKIPKNEDANYLEFLIEMSIFRFFLLFSFDIKSNKLFKLDKISQTFWEKEEIGKFVFLGQSIFN